jgi:uncharacterized protein
VHPSEIPVGGDDHADQAVLTNLRLRMFQLYALFGNPTADWDLDSDTTRRALAEHVSFLRRLEAEGVMFMGGPFRAPDHAWNGSGVIFVRATSLVLARSIADQDPLLLRGLRTYDVRGWQLNEGRLNFTLDLDSNAIGLS